MTESLSMSLQKGVVIWGLLLLFALNLPNSAASKFRNLSNQTVSQCLHYEPATVNLKGQIVRGTFVNASGKKETVWLLKLDSPICVTSDEADSINEKADHVTRLQLVLTPKDYKNYQKYLTKKAFVGGTLFYGHTQHHFTEVLLSVTEIR